MRPSISVIVPTFNRARLLGQCLDSLLEQSLPPRQILVVDDGSQDGTNDLIASYSTSVQSIRTDNCGKSAAVNSGLKHVGGEYVWVLDDDDVALPDALERLVDPLVSDSRVGFSFGTKLFCDCAPDGSIGEIIGESRVPDRYDRLFVLRLLKSCFLGGASTLVRRSVYEMIGGYDTSLVRSQDYEMALRISLRFSGARVAGGPTYYHRRHAGLRGSLADRFPSTSRMEKWKKYNQIFIRRLCNELPLETFSPIEDDVSRRSGGNLLPALERTAVRAAHGLLEDAERDIELLSRRSFDGPVTRAERLVAEEIGRRLGASAMGPDFLVRTLRDAHPEMAPLIAAIRRHIRLTSAWHSLPGPAKRCLRFARSRVVSAD
jgi:glycosyltransferase involved in cell wall biosynthesis